MNKLFRLDGKFVHYSTKLTYLLWLQVLTVLCSLPVITAGAAFTAMHKILLQIYRDEEASITKTFFRAFKQNLRQATILWVLYLVIFGLMLINGRLALYSTEPVLRIFVYFLPVIIAFVAFSFVWVFPLQARYQNSILGTVKLSFTMIFYRPLITILMALLAISPFAFLLFTLYAFPYVVLLGCTLPGLLQVMLYNRVFKNLEGE